MYVFAILGKYLDSWAGGLCVEVLVSFIPSDVVVKECCVCISFCHSGVFFSNNGFMVTLRWYIHLWEMTYGSSRHCNPQTYFEQRMVPASLEVTVTPTGYMFVYNRLGSH